MPPGHKESSVCQESAGASIGGEFIKIYLGLLHRVMLSIYFSIDHVHQYTGSYYFRAPIWIFWSQERTRVEGGAVGILVAAPSPAYYVSQ